MLKKILSCALLLTVVLSASAQSGKIVISKYASSGKDAVSIADLRFSGEAGQLFFQVLKKDLESSGWFEVKQDRSTNFTISGVASSQGQVLNTNIRVQWSGGVFAWSESSQTTRDARWQAHRLSDKIVKTVKGVDGMASTRIVFVGKGQNRSGGLYLCDYDGANAGQLTNEKISPLSPCFDPRGQFIFYTSFDKGFPCVFRVPATGGVRSPYAQFTGLNTGGAVSPDGKYLAIILSHVGNPELFVLDIARRQVFRQTHTQNATEASPCWSPDGNRIAYVSDQSGTPQIYVVDSNTHVSKRISHRGSQNVAPSWGPDGRIAYCTKQSGYQIAIYDPATGTEEVLTDGPDHEDPSWAPDGRHIICSRKLGPSSYALCIVDTKDRSFEMLHLPQGNWHAPDWSRSLYSASAGL